MTETGKASHSGFTVNNFDLLRLLAAAQVAFHHTLGHLKIEHSDWWITRFTQFFPGVPIFFFVSGFLISRSYERQPSLISYGRNRLLRLYPALIVCTLVGILGAWHSGYFETVRVTWSSFLIWVLSQVTFVQFYNPDFMRGYGVGVLNGSLWTICIELQFYVLVPILYRWFRIHESGRYRLPLLALVFMILNVIIIGVESRMAQETLAIKLIKITFVPWFYMFLIGVLFQRNYEALRPYLHNRGVIYLAAYLVLAYVLKRYAGMVLGNSIGPVMFIPLIIAMSSCAYTWPQLSDLILRRNDISYGVYVYHMPVVNYLLANQAGPTWTSLATSLSLTFGLAIFSWILVEKPCMKLKRFSIHTASGSSSPTVLPPAAVANPPHR